MPTSNYAQLNAITQLIKATDPEKLLDVGTGFGKYGFLAREYLELWDHRQNYKQWTRQIDGIEAFADYIGPLQQSIYDMVHLGNALDVLPTLDTKYDLVLLIDVLEHFTRDEGSRLLKACLQAGRNLLVAVPKPFTHQGAAFENEFEMHRCDWQARHFAPFRKKFFLRTKCSLICYLGEDSRRVEGKSLNLPRRCYSHILSGIAAITTNRSRHSADQ